MKRMIKRILGIALSMIILLSLVPVGVMGAETDAGSILDDAYALSSGDSLSYEATLTGKITQINTPYSSSFRNITVTIVVPGYESKPMLCYRIKGEGADKLAVGDTITVTGTIINYNGTIEFQAGSALDKVVSVGASSDKEVCGPEDKEVCGPDSLAVVGTGLPGIKEWDPADPAGNMTEISDNIYEIILNCSAGTHMAFKIAGNDMWVDAWNFGSATIVLGQWTELECGGGSADIHFSVEKACTLRIVVDLNPVYYGQNAKMLVATDTYRVVGNWNVPSGSDLMDQIVPNVYQKCFYDVAPGKYEFYVNKNDSEDDIWDNNGKPYTIHVGKTSTVTVTLDLREGNGIVEVDYVRLAGDVTGDGRLNMGDVAKLYAHIRSTAPLTDQTALTCADFTGDGKLNIGDTARVYAYIRGTDPASVVDAVYQLAENQEMSVDKTLTGKVLSIIEPYNAKYNCITVSMVVAGREDYPIVCSRLMGAEGADISTNDNITVTGRLRNFYGSIEFKEGCQLVKWENVLTAEELMAEIVDEAYGLRDNEVMDHPVTLTGKVVSIDQAYSASLPYISVTISVPGREDKPISCYRMVGDQIAIVKKDDTVTVTGTLRNFYGTIEFVEGCRLEEYVPGNVNIVMETDPLRIVDIAYALPKDTEMNYDVSLTGKVSSIKDAYDANYKNITVIIQVAGRESKPILVYRLKGDGIAYIAVNDTITVIGRLKNYKGTVEMDNATMSNRISGGGTPVIQQTDPAKIMAAAKALAENAELSYDVTLFGKVTSIDEAYNAEFKSVTATISVNGTSDSLKLYRLKGDGVEKLAVGDTITATGRLKNYYGEIEMVNCTMTARTSGGGTPSMGVTDYKKIVDEAYALASGDSLSYIATLQGEIIELQSPYDANYKNMTVVIAVEGREDKPIICYRMKGEDIGNHLCVGDTITVEGTIKNYNGIIEFDAGCRMIDYKAGSTSKPADPKKIVDAAFALGENEVLPYFATLTGKVKSIDQAYDAQYRNVTLTMTVQGTNGAQDIVCYRLKGDQAANVAVGNTITVTGAIKRFVRDQDGIREDRVEFDSGCILDALIR